MMLRRDPRIEIFSLKRLHYERGRAAWRSFQFGRTAREVRMVMRSYCVTASNEEEARELLLRNPSAYLTYEEVDEDCLETLDDTEFDLIAVEGEQRTLSATTTLRQDEGGQQKRAEN